LSGGEVRNGDRAEKQRHFWIKRTEPDSLLAVLYGFPIAPGKGKPATEMRVSRCRVRVAAYSSAKRRD
jgi:hypothetical protein